MYQRVIDVLTVAVLLLTLTLTVVLLRGQDSAPPTVGLQDTTVPGWEDFADVDRSSGPEGAPVTILYYGDYECPACRSFEPQLQTVLERYSAQVRIVYRHFPLAQHRLAYPAARAAECARSQGKFIEFHRQLYGDDQWLLDPRDSFIRYATGTGIRDLSSFATCLDDDAAMPAIEEDRRSTAALGLKGTPSVIINGLLVGARRDSARLTELVEEALRNANDA